MSSTHERCTTLVGAARHASSIPLRPIKPVANVQTLPRAEIRFPTDCQPLVTVSNRDLCGI